MRVVTSLPHETKEEHDLRIPVRDGVRLAARVWRPLSSDRASARSAPPRSPDDRFADDMHYMRGCLLSDNLAESGTMFAHSTCPPDPAVVGDRWRRMWTERLDAARPWVAEWLRHQRRDDYWRHASVCEDYAAVQVPVFASCGWADGYSNAVLRLMA